MFSWSLVPFLLALLILSAHELHGTSSSNQHAAASCLLDLDLSDSAEELGFDDNWLFGKEPLAQDFVIAL